MSGKSRHILVINPNSNQAVTDGMDAALGALKSSGGVQIECVTEDAGRGQWRYRSRGFALARNGGFAANL